MYSIAYINVHEMQKLKQAIRKKTKIRQPETGKKKKKIEMKRKAGNGKRGGGGEKQVKETLQFDQLKTRKGGKN